MRIDPTKQAAKAIAEVDVPHLAWTDLSSSARAAYYLMARAATEAFVAAAQADAECRP